MLNHMMSIMHVDKLLSQAITIISTEFSHISLKRSIKNFMQLDFLLTQHRKRILQFDYFLLLQDKHFQL